MLPIEIALKRNGSVTYGWTVTGVSGWVAHVDSKWWFEMWYQKSWTLSMNIASCVCFPKAVWEPFESIHSIVGVPGGNTALFSDLADVHEARRRWDYYQFASLRTIFGDPQTGDDLGSNSYNRYSEMLTHQHAGFHSTEFLTPKGIGEKLESIWETSLIIISLAKFIGLEINTQSKRCPRYGPQNSHNPL